MVLWTAASAQGAPLIFRIDNARVTTVDRRLQISATGAVRTGGWSNPQLRIKQASASEANTLEVEFTAEPPRPDDAVVQGLMPVQATKLAPLPHYGATQVRFIGETNSVTVPIGK